MEAGLRLLTCKKPGYKVKSLVEVWSPRPRGMGDGWEDGFLFVGNRRAVYFYNISKKGDATVV